MLNKQDESVRYENIVFVFDLTATCRKLFLKS